MAEIMDFAKGIFRGQTLSRTLLQRLIRRHCQDIQGLVLDLASGGEASYHRYLPQTIRLIRADYKQRRGIDRIVDANKNLPFGDESFDAILFFNALYIIKDRMKLLRELRRILKPNGVLFLSSPLIASEIPEPNDFCRLTSEGLSKELHESGWNDIRIVRYGERFSVAANLLHPFFVFSVIRVVIYPLALLLDRLIPRGLREKHPTPLGYFCIIKK